MEIHKAVARSCSKFQNYWSRREAREMASNLEQSEKANSEVEEWRSFGSGESCASPSVKVVPGTPSACTVPMSLLASSRVKCRGGNSLGDKGPWLRESARLEQGSRAAVQDYNVPSKWEQANGWPRLIQSGYGGLRSPADDITLH
ncbi:questionable protein [Neurospora crassa]|uniref:Questionable protein n=1 Tax=Neurospora crassa TaxID=5141 RepID=Q6MVX2_NEUCS|nr:questionable protein [Neurospora crassa]CAE76179.1 questionable protein [Neurospora crassa]